MGEKGEEIREVREGGRDGAEMGNKKEEGERMWKKERKIRRK